MENFPASCAQVNGRYRPQRSVEDRRQIAGVALPLDWARMSYPIHIVDVFTDRALAGNQLAVVLDADGITPDVMQRIAREMNFSETTFVLAPLRPEHAARVRIFTPGTEL